MQNEMNDNRYLGFGLESRIHNGGLNGFAVESRLQFVPFAGKGPSSRSVSLSSPSHPPRLPHLLVYFYECHDATALHLCFPKHNT